ncbi:MAG: hypothetical protein IKP88_12410 [Lachnospiraceae bacterium]|nr:hypothetical protein [Lachnospiraceae bacterium]
MDYLGKLCDTFILIAVLFIFPISWALCRSMNGAEAKIADTTAEYMEQIDSKGYIEKSDLEKFRRKIGSLGEYFVDISILKRNSDIVELWDFSENIGLMHTDTLILKISDRESTVYSAMRVIL